MLVLKRFISQSIPLHLWMPFGSTAVYYNHKQLRFTTWNFPKKNPPFQTQSQAQLADVFSFCSLVRFDVSWGRSAWFINNLRLKSDDYLVSYWLIPARPRTGTSLICSHPQTDITRSHPPLCYCFLCIETPVCGSLSSCCSLHKEWAFNSVYHQIHRLLWRSQNTHLKVCVWV